MAPFWKVHSRPVWVAVLCSAQVCSPACDVSDFEAMLLKEHHVVSGWGPDTQTIVSMVDQVQLPFVWVCLSREKGWWECNCCEHGRAFNVWEFREDPFPDNTCIWPCAVAPDRKCYTNLFGMSNNFGIREARGSTNSRQRVCRQQLGEKS